MNAAAQASAASDGGSAARRAVMRWAWRLFRREWAQQFAVLVLIVAAVAATVLGAAVATNTPPAANAGFGTADHLVALPGGDPRLADNIAALRQHFGAVDVIDGQVLPTGLAQAAELRAQDPKGPFGRPMLSLESGRFPTAAGEIAMTHQLAVTFGAHVGGTWTNGGTQYRVVGVVENPQDLLDNFALLPPGQLRSPTTVTVLFDATDATFATYTPPHGVTVQAPATSSGISPAIIVFAIAMIG